MEVAVRPEPNESIIFRYSNRLKTLFKKGKLPSVKYGFYGDKITKKNVSLEHLQAKSKGGKSTLANYVLASRDKNNARGNEDIKDYFDKDAAELYLDQFINVAEKGLYGKKYIKMILITLHSLGVDTSFYSLKKKFGESVNKSLDYMA